MTHTTKGFVALPLILIAFAAIGAGTVASAHHSLPGDLLYGVKSGVEKAQVALAIGSDKALVHMNIASEKAREIQGLEKKGASPERILQAVTKLEEHQEKAVSTQDGMHIDKVEGMQSDMATQAAVLQEVLTHTPPAAQPGIENAITASERYIQETKIEKVLPEKAGKANNKKE